MSQAAVLGPSSSTPEGASPSYSSEEDVSSSSSSSSSSFSGPSTPPNMHQNTIDPSAKWLVQKFGGTSVGKFAVRIAEDIVSCVFSFKKIFFLFELTRFFFFLGIILISIKWL
jgi:hypothetical protein